LCYNMAMWITALHKRTKQLDYWDVKMIVVSMVCLGFVFGRLVPELIDANPWWWGTLVVLFLLRPTYHFWVKASDK